MSKNITLYYANWCGHCTTFKPIWNSLKSKLDKNGIIHNEYEYSENKAEVEAANIHSFPTIKITKDGKTTEYKGPRKEQDILKALGINEQSGGSPTINYYYKYMKYKQKYDALKTQIGGLKD